MLVTIFSSAQTGEQLLHVQPRKLVDSTTLIVCTTNSDYSVLYWNNKVLKLDKIDEDLNKKNQTKHFTTLHWNNKVIKLIEDHYATAPHRAYGKFENPKIVPNCQSGAHKKRHI